MNTSATMSTVNSEMPTNGAAGTSTFDRHSDPRSPLTLGGNLGASTLSMRAKAARKRRINARHNSNFHAGFVPVDEAILQRSGIRGRKRFFLYCVVATLMLVALCNLAVTAWLLHILGMTHYGLWSFELLSLGGRDFLRVLTDANIDTISMGSAPLGARFDSSLNILAERSTLNIETAANKSMSSVKMEDGRLTLTTKEFSIKTKDSQRWVSANLASMAQQNIINNLYFEENITVSQINEGNEYKDLYIESTMSNTIIEGQEKVIISTSNWINVTAPSVSLRAQSTINVLAPEGIYLDSLVPTSPRGNNNSRETYKVCVCNTGRVFAVKGRRNSKPSCAIGKKKLKKICGNKDGWK